MNDHKKHISWGLPALTALALIALGAVAHAAPPAYTLTDLGVLPYETSSQGQGVNDRGQVTGYSYTTMSNGSNSNDHAFLSGPGGGPLKDLGTLGSINGFNGTVTSMGNAVNASGQVAGVSNASGNTSARAFGHPPIRLAIASSRTALRLAAVSNGGTSHAFLSDPNGGTLHDLGTLPGAPTSFGYAVNASGQVTGESGNRAFLSDPNGGALHDLGNLPGGGLGRGFGVNASGQVAGDSISSNGGYDQAFMTGPNGTGPVKDLGGLPGRPFSLGLGINASGQVVGYADEGFSNTGQTHAFLSGPNGGPLQDLGTLPGADISRGFGVNDSGQAVGDSGPFSGPLRPFLYSDGTMTDLNTLIAPGSGFTLYQATYISNNGFITGTGTASDGTTHAFLLTPIVVNSGPKITVTAFSSTADALGQRTVTVTTTNTGGSAADMLTLTSVTLGGAAPLPPPASPSPVPTTPNLLSNKPGSNTQTNKFVFLTLTGTTRAVLNVGGTYVDQNNATDHFSAAIRLALP